MGIWEGLSDFVTSFWDALVSGASKLSALFYTTGEGGGITMYGYMLIAVIGTFIVSLGIGLFFRLLNYIKRRKVSRSPRR